MNIYRQIYKANDGKNVKTSNYYIDFLDHNKIRRKIAAFDDKRTTEAFGRNIESLINCRLSGLEHDVRLNQWLETLPMNILKKFTAWGLIDGGRAEITKPLSEHIDDYIKVLKVKGFSGDYITRSQSRLTKIVEGCRFHYFRDITKSAVEIYSGRLKKEDSLCPTSRNHYIAALRTFLKWCQRDGRILNNVLAEYQNLDENRVQKGILTPEQFINLVKITFEKNTLIDNVSGQERAVLYVLAGTTGLRRNELLNLTWNDINLSDDNPFVKVRACIAKNGKEALQPLPAITFNLLTALKGQIKPLATDRVFSAFGKGINTAKLIQDDLKAADIKLIDKDGNEICFHSLRNSYISWLANSQTPAKVVQKLARHSDPKLTFNVYARTLPEAEKQAINYLPNFGDIFTGKNLCDNLCVSGTNSGTQRDNKGKQIDHTIVNTAILAQSQAAEWNSTPLEGIAQN